MRVCNLSSNVWHPMTLVKGYRTLRIGVRVPLQLVVAKESALRLQPAGFVKLAQAGAILLAGLRQYRDRLGTVASC
jgi:hypothetical protein